MIWYDMIWYISYIHIDTYLHIESCCDLILSLASLFYPPVCICLCVLPFTKKCEARVFERPSLPKRDVVWKSWMVLPHDLFFNLYATFCFSTVFFVSEQLVICVDLMRNKCAIRNVANMFGYNEANGTAGTKSEYLVWSASSKLSDFLVRFSRKTHVLCHRVFASML